MQNDSGSVSIQTIIIILFVAAVGTGAFILLQSVLTRVARHTQDSTDFENEAIEVVTAIMEAMERDSTPSSDSRFDIYYELSGEADFAIEIYDISSFINPNWIRKQPFEETQLGNLFEEGVTASVLQQFREDFGFSQDIAGFYKNFFSPANFNQYFTAFSYANINSADEFALRKLYAQVVGSESGANAFHGRIQGLLLSGELLQEENLPLFLGAEGQALLRVITTRPQWNVNYAPSFILQAILSYPAYHIAAPNERALLILAARNAREIDRDELRGILSLAEDHPIFSYLGCETFFWRVIITKGEQQLTAIVARDLTAPPENKKIKLVALERR
jgi:hypothetical protein